MSKTFSAARLSLSLGFIACLLALSSFFFLSPGALHAQTVAGTVRVGGNPFGIAVNTATNQVYVANSDDNNVTVINGDTNDTIYVATGLAPQAVAVNPVTNKIYVANLNSGTVTVIDGTTYSTTTIGAGTSPDAVAINTVTNTIYVTNRDSATVTIIDGATNSASAVSVGAYPRALAVNVVTNKIYVANRDDGTVSVIDGASNTVTATISVGTKPRAVAVNPVTNQIYVGNWQSNNVTIIDGASNNTTTVTAGTSPRSVAVNPVTNKIYVANIDSNDVTVIEGATQATSTLKAGKAPRSVAVDSVTDTIYVTNRDSNSVTVINDGTNSTFSLNSPGAPRAVAVNPVTHRVYVGNRGNMKVTVIDGSANGSVAVSTGQNPSAVAANPATGKIYVANSDNTVTVINTVANTTAPIAVGTNPVAVAVNPVTNQIYVANQGSDDVTVIDGATDTPTSPSVSVGTSPVAIAVNPATNKIYVADQDSNDVAVIDGSTTNAILVPAGTTPVAIAINPVTDQIYVANQDDNDVTVIDGASNSTTTIMADITPVAIAVNPVTNLVYVANQGSNDVTVINGASTTTFTVMVGLGPAAIDVNPITNMIYVANQTGNDVTVIYGAVNDTLKVPVGTAPAAVVVNPVTNHVYVVNQEGNDLTVIDGATNHASFISVGTSPSAVAFNSATQQVVVANSGDNNVTVITPAAAEAIPFTAQVQGVVDSETASGTAIFATTNSAPAFQASASSTFSPFALAPTALYYQLDTLQQQWQMATATTPGAYSFSLNNVASGVHTLYVFPAYGNEASTEDSVSGSVSPQIGSLTAYPFGELATLGTPPASYPVFTPAPGVYGSSQTVTLSDATPGAAIYYTLDGTTPTTASTRYAGALMVSQSMIIKAIATATGYTPSDVANGNYTIGYPPAAPPLFTPPPGPYDAAPTVTLSDTTAGAKIYYTTDGTLPTSDNSNPSSKQYTGSITVILPETIRATAFAPKFSESAIVTAEYRLPLTDPPSFSLPSGSYGGPQTLTLSDDDSTAVIYYSFNNYDYTQYTQPIPITPPSCVWAYALAPDHSNSIRVWNCYNQLPTANPKISPLSGIYTAPQWVTITDDTPGATIYYTTDPNWPYYSSWTPYNGTFQVPLPTTIHAIAVAQGYSYSSWVSADYEPLRAPTPIIYLYASRGVGPQDVTLKEIGDPNAVIYYTTDNTVPTAASTPYKVPFQITPPTLVQAIAIDPNLYPSFISQALYQLKTKEKVIFTPAPGIYEEDSVSVRMSLSEPPPTGGYVYYTIDGSKPVIDGKLNPLAKMFDPNSSLSISVTTHLRLRAVAVVNGVISGPIDDATYRIVPKTAVPTFSTTNSGTYCGLASVTLSSGSKTAIYYTLDGSTPTEGSTSVIGNTAITIGDGVTITAFALATNHLPSPVVSKTFQNACTLTLTPPATSPTYGQTAVVSMALSMTNPGTGIAGPVQVTVDGKLWSTVSMKATQTGQTVNLSLTRLPVGTHTVNATFTAGNATSTPGIFTVAAQTQFTVQAALLTVTANTVSRFYEVANPTTFYGTVRGLVYGETIAVIYGTEATVSSPVIQGGYAIVPQVPDPTNQLGTLTQQASNAKVLSNYTLKTNNGTLTILPLSVTVSANSKSRYYGDPDPAFTSSISASTSTQQFMATDGISFSYSSSDTAATPVGTYTKMITLTTDANANNVNYAITLVPATLTIHKAPFTVTAPSSLTRLWGAPDPDLTPTITATPSVLATMKNDGISYTDSYSNPNATLGTFHIIPQLSDSTKAALLAANYSPTIHDGSISITAPTVTIAIDNQSRIYGQADPTFTGTVSADPVTTAALTNDGISIKFTCTDTSSTPVGTKSIVATITPASKAANYKFSTTDGTLTITKATLTVTVNPQTMPVGGPIPTLTGTVTGISSYDASTTPPRVSVTYSTNATTRSKAGPYAITPAVHFASGVSGNYTVNDPAGVLTVQ
jgi:YVTN family beta-propeller protein